MEPTTPEATIDCPYCAEPINPRSKKCRHCGELLDPQMRELALLREQRSNPQVFMNAGGAAAAAATSGNEGLHRFPHLLHIIISILTGLLWLPIYLLMYLFRNKRYYY